MSDIQVFLADNTANKLLTLFEESPSCEWGGVFIGDIEMSGDSFKVFIYDAVNATYKESFINEFRTTSQVWKEFYAQRDLHYPRAKIIGWYTYDPQQSWKPSSLHFDTHKKFFDQAGQVFFFIDRSGALLCHVISEDFKELIPVNYSEYSGKSPGKKTKTEINEEKSPGDLLNQGLKKAGVFFLFFVVCLLGIAYRDLTKPILQNKIASLELKTEKLKQSEQQQQTVPTGQPDKNQNPEPDFNPQTPNGVSVIEGLEATDSEDENYYVVEKGDSLWKISEKFYGSGFSFYKIMQANDIFNPSQLYIGQKLYIP